jgi:hypothetical protein
MRSFRTGVDPNVVTATLIGVVQRVLRVDPGTVIDQQRHHLHV